MAPSTQFYDSSLSTAKPFDELPVRSIWSLTQRCFRIADPRHGEYHLNFIPPAELEFLEQGFGFSPAHDLDELTASYQRA